MAEFAPAAESAKPVARFAVTPALDWRFTFAPAERPNEASSDAERPARSHGHAQPGARRQPRAESNGGAGGGERELAAQIESAPCGGVHADPRRELRRTLTPQGQPDLGRRAEPRREPDAGRRPQADADADASGGRSARRGCATAIVIDRLELLRPVLAFDRERDFRPEEAPSAAK
jgi:hypothetical protein